MADSLEADVRAIGRTLHDAFPARWHAPRRALEDLAIARMGARPDMQAAFFRFVDVVPACRSAADRAEHLTALVADAGEPGPALGRLTRAGRARGVRGLLGRASVGAVHATGRRFIAGEDADDAAGELRRLWRDGQAWSLDLLGEHTVTAAEADRYQARCAETLERLARVAADWPQRPLLEADGAGPLPRVNLSIKVSALTAQVRDVAPERGIADALPRVRALARQARELGAHLHLDMESFDARELVMGLLTELLADPELADGPSLGIVLQAYLQDSGEQLDRLLELARAARRASPLTVRLVKGAYWDQEMVLARQHGWPAPTFEAKAATDRNFEALTRRLLDARPLVRVAVASHNLRSVAHAVAYNRAVGGSERDLELQVLRGLGDELGAAAARLGLRVRVYTPIGSLVEGMAYLVRRLLENTSNDSFLSAVAHGETLDRLLMAP